MTEINEMDLPKTGSSEGRPDLPAVVEAFILQWGDLGSFWGVNRSIAQIHALLYLSEQPMTAEQIAELLEIARSNVSNSIKELLSWELIYRVPIRGDRRDHFVAETDLWLISKRIAAGRKARELDPASRILKSCVAAANIDADLSPIVRQRLHDMAEFVAAADRWYEDMLTIPHSTLKTLMGLGSRITSILTRKGGAK